jgi:hypothetical protein
MNLLAETKDAIKNSGHTPDNIRFIGSRESGHCCTWAEFCNLADVEYNNDFGSQEVASDLIVVFDDGSSMWRREHAGAESWEFSVPFSMHEQLKPLSKLVVSEEQVGWKTLAELNK